MSPPYALPGGELERAVLRTLWEKGSASVREIHERVGVPAGLVYTTVAKVLDRLYAKGLVSRRRVGLAFTYRPRLDREVVERALPHRLVAALFEGEIHPAIVRLVEEVESADPELLDALAREVAARRRIRRGP